MTMCEAPACEAGRAGNDDVHDTEDQDDPAHLVRLQTATPAWVNRIAVAHE
jgi:hypothetical protein